MNAVEAAEKLSKILSDVKVEARGDVLYIEVSSESFSLSDLPREALEVLARVNGLIVVVLPGNYYLYFRESDVKRVLEILSKKKQVG